MALCCVLSAKEVQASLLAASTVALKSLFSFWQKCATVSPLKPAQFRKPLLYLARFKNIAAVYPERRKRRPSGTSCFLFMVGLPAQLLGWTTHVIT